MPIVYKKKEGCRNQNRLAAWRVLVGALRRASGVLRGGQEMPYRSRFSSRYDRRQPRRAFLGWLAGAVIVAVGGVAAWWSGWLSRVPGLPSPGAGVGLPSGGATVTAPGASPAAGGTAVIAQGPAVELTATPPPVETAEAVGRRFLIAWQVGDFAAMYAELSPAAQARIGQQVFVNRYEAIRDEAGISKVTATVTPGASSTGSGVPYEARIETRVGVITEQQTVPLSQADGRWGVDWQPSLIFKDLKGERLISIPARHTGPRSHSRSSRYGPGADGRSARRWRHSSRNQRRAGAAGWVEPGARPGPGNNQEALRLRSTRLVHADQAVGLDHP